MQRYTTNETEDFHISILIIEDDPLFRNYLANLVNKLGYPFTVVDEPERAKKLLIDGYFNIVIASTYLQNYPGINILNTITEHHPGKDVILVMSPQENFSLSEVIAQGAVDYLNKPFSVDEARAKISRVIRERKLIHELVEENKKRLKIEEELRKSQIFLEERVLERTKKLEEAKLVAEQATEAQSEFIANISHELRTPIHGILSFARLGRDKIDILTKDRIISYFNEIIVSAERLYVLLSNLLDLSKLEAAMMHYEPANHCLYETIEQNIQSIRALAEEKRVQLICKNTAKKTNIQFDKDKISQVIQNVIVNAIKFTNEGSMVSVLLKESKLSEDATPDDNYLLVEIIDQGIGVPDGELDHIFDKFKQSTRTKSGAGGTGLGLAICRRIIDDHGGKIWASNSEGGGTKFSFALPCKQN